MIILDTNVLSALMQTSPEEIVIEWLDRVPAESVWITSITLFEARYGPALLPDGERRKILSTLFEEIVEKDLEGRVLLFDQMASEQAAYLAAARKKNGHTRYARHFYCRYCVCQKSNSCYKKHQAFS